MRPKRLWVILIFIILITSVSILIAISKDVQGVFDNIFGVHVTYGNDPTSEVNIIWLSYYGTANRLKITFPNGTDRTLQASASDWKVAFLHRIRLSGLEAGKEYTCTIFGSNTEFKFTFRTLNITYDHIRIVVAGDSRTGIIPRGMISNLIKMYKPEFILHTGDIVEEGDEIMEWLDWIQHQSTLRDGLRVIPVMPTLGNHERNSSYYYELYEVNRWYLLKFWKLSIVLLNSEFGFDSQRNWLEGLNLSGTMIIGIWHRTVISSGPHGNATDFYNKVVTILESKGMVLGFQGHNHHYSRSKPIRNGTLSSNGTIYITTGGWGAPLASADRYPSWADSYSVSYHFVVLDIYENGIYGRVIDINNKVIDEFSLTF